MDMLTIMGISFVIMFAAMGFILLWAFLRPVWPYLSAKFGGKDLLLAIDANNRIKLLPVKYSSGTFTFEKGKKGDKNHLVLKWFLRPPTRSYALGDVRACIVSSEYGIAMDERMNAAIEVLIEHGYKNYEEFVEGVQNGEINKDTEIEISAVRYVPVHEIMNYVSPIKPSSIAAELEEKISNINEDFQIRVSKLASLLPKQSGGNAGMWVMIIIIIMFAALGYYVVQSGALKNIIPHLLASMLTFVH